MKISNVKVARHRNGISGEPFSVTLFDMEEDGEKHRMVGILFGETGECAVLDLDLLQGGDIGRGSNSWRGDHFEDELREHISRSRS